MNPSNGLGDDVSSVQFVQVLDEARVPLAVVFVKTAVDSGIMSPFSVS